MENKILENYHDRLKEVLQVSGVFSFEKEIHFWQEVKQEIEKL